VYVTTWGYPGFGAQEDMVGMLLCGASLSPLKSAKLVDLGCIHEDLVTHFLQTCHGLQGLRCEESMQKLQDVLVGRGLERGLRSLSWASSNILDCAMPLLESLGVKNSELDADFFRDLFPALKRDSPLIRFLALGTDSQDFEISFANVFLRVPTSIEHLFLDFDGCHFVGIRDFLGSARRDEQAVMVFDYLRPFVPSSVHLHICCNQHMTIPTVCDVVREKYLVDDFISTSRTA